MLNPILYKVVISKEALPNYRIEMDHKRKGEESIHLNFGTKSKMNQATYSKNLGEITEKLKELNKNSTSSILITTFHTQVSNIFQMYAIDILA